MPQPVIVSSGRTNLRITDSDAVAFKSKYGISCKSTQVPFISVPKGSKISGIKYTDLIGYCALVINLDNGRSTYAVLGSYSNSTSGWTTVSYKVSESLGFTKGQANPHTSPNGNFTILLFLDRKPSWSKSISMITQINNVGNEVSKGYSYTELSGTAANILKNGNVNLDAINEYIITIDRNTKTAINYDSMKELGVVGVMIEAGKLFDATHSKVKFRNPKLDGQVSTAVRSNLPFAWYSEVCARNTQEALQEMYQLSFIIRKYPPILGVWLKLNLVKSKSINDSILKTYQDELVKLGLKNRIGLYVNKSQLNQISWDKFCNDWYLWYIDHVDNITEINNLLTPEFFVVK